MHYLSTLLQIVVYDFEQNNHKRTFYGMNIKLLKPNILNENSQAYYFIHTTDLHFYLNYITTDEFRKILTSIPTIKYLKIV